MVRPIDTSLEQRLPLSTDIALQRRFMVVKEPLPGNVRYGLLLEVVDKLAEEVALRHARRTDPQAYVVMAAIEKVALRTPGDVNRDIELKARLNWVGKSSMEVGIRVEQPGSAPTHMASCYFTMVARVGEGDEARSVAVEPLEYLEAIDASRRDKARRAYELATIRAEELAPGRDRLPDDLRRGRALPRGVPMAPTAQGTTGGGTGTRDSARTTVCSVAHADARAVTIRRLGGGVLAAATLVRLSAAQGTPCMSRRAGSVPATYAAIVARERALVCERLATHIPAGPAAAARNGTLA